MARRSRVLPFQPDPTPAPDLIALLGDIEDNTAPPSQVKNTAFPIILADVDIEKSHTLQAGVRALEVKFRDNRASATIRLDFVSGGVNTANYKTVFPGTTWSKDFLKLGYSTLYLRCDKVGVIEITEYF